METQDNKIQPYFTQKNMECSIYHRNIFEIHLISAYIKVEIVA